MVVFFCFLVISAVLSGYNLWEWYTVEKLNHIDSYNFGDVSNRAYYYNSQSLYAFIHLFWGIGFSLSALFMVFHFLIKKKWYVWLNLIFFALIFGIYIVHGLVAQ
jgi:hypothetical protein